MSSAANRPRPRTHPIATLFGFITYLSANNIGVSPETNGILVLNAAPGFRFNWVRYFSSFPSPRETPTGIHLPPTSNFTRKSPFDLLGEIVLETTRLIEPYQSVIMNVHICFYMKDLKFRRLANRLSALSKYSSSEESPMSQEVSPTTCASWVEPTTCSTPSSLTYISRTHPVSSQEGIADIPLYLHYHEIRRLQLLNPLNYPDLHGLIMFPAVTVKVCNQSETKVETTGKLISLKIPKVRENSLKVSTFVPSPGMRQRTSVKSKKADAPLIDQSNDFDTPPSSRTSQGPTIDLEKSTIDSLDQTEEELDFEGSPLTSASAYEPFNDSTDCLISGPSPASEDIDRILHPSIKGSIISALETCSDNIDEVFKRVYQDVCTLIEEGGIAHTLLTDSILVSQSVWRGIQEVCCGGSLSPRLEDSHLSEASANRFESSNFVSLDDYQEDLPALQRLESFEVPLTPHSANGETRDEDDVRSTNDTSSRLYRDVESVSDGISSPSGKRSSVLSAQSAPSLAPPYMNASQQSRKQTIRDEEYMHMHTRERILRRCSTDLDGDEATELTAYLDSVESQAMPYDALPAAYAAWAVVIPRPANLPALQAQILAKHRNELIESLERDMSANFILNSLKERLIRSVETHIRKQLCQQELKSDRHKGDQVTDSALESDMDAAMLASDIVDPLVLKALCARETIKTKQDLYHFMSGNMGVKVQSQGMYQGMTTGDEKDPSKRRNYLWTSYVEEISKFTWFTNETTIRQSRRGENFLRTYRFLRPQLFRSPQFSPSLIARRHVIEAWEAIPCKTRKIINEQMIATLNFGVNSIESLQDAQWIPSVIKEGSEEWQCIFREHGYLPFITSVEWELLYCDFITEGIQSAAVAHLRELA